MTFSQIPETREKIVNPKKSLQKTQLSLQNPENRYKTLMKFSSTEL